jgi:hypothetical protein
VLLFTTLAYIGSAGLRGANVTFQVAVVEGGVGSQTGRATAAVGFLAGARGQWTFQLPQDVRVGAPYNRFGFRGGERLNTPVTLGDSATTIEDWAANIGETNQAAVIGAAPIPFQIAASLAPSADLLGISGTLTNQSATPLARAFLVNGDAFIDLPDLAPGETYTIDPLLISQGFPYGPFFAENEFSAQSQAIIELFELPLREEPGFAGANQALKHPFLVVISDQAAIPAQLTESGASSYLTAYVMYLYPEER